jgi:tripartite-type tricarboxylate transporter receptor subunit TctC
MIGMAAVASAPPDGYTVAASSSTTLTLVGMTNHNVPYKIEHFIPLGNYAIDAGAIVVHGDSPWKTLEDLIAHAGQNPGKLSYGSPGSGSVSSFVVEAIKVQYDVKMVEVPFQGSPPANMAVLGKQVDFATVAFSNAAPMLNAGKLRALATSSETRLPGYPDIPTLAEKGVRNASLGLTLGLYAAAKTPAHAVDVLATSLGIAMQNQSVTQSLEKAGLFVKYADRHGAQRQLDVEYRDVLELGRRLNRMQQQ